MLLESVIAFLSQGWRVIVAVPNDGPLVPHLAETGAEVRVIENPVLRKAYLSLFGLIRCAWSLLQALPRVWRQVDPRQVDVVFVNTLTVPLWLTVARLRRIPVVCHVHEAEADEPKLVRLALVLPLLLARLIIANSAASRDVILRDLPRLKDRMLVVYNGFDGPARAKSPRQHLTGTTRLILLGRISPRKGTDVAVAAVAQLVRLGCDVTLDLVGGVFPGYEWFERDVRAQIAAAGLADRVRWCGETPDQWGAFQAADIALVPSRVEPFGNTAVEAMLAERPVVASATQGLVEIVDPRRTGELVPPGDSTALAGRIWSLMDDWPRALRLARRGRLEASRRFSRQNYRGAVAGAVATVLPGVTLAAAADVTLRAASPVTTVHEAVPAERPAGHREHLGAVHSGDHRAARTRRTVRSGEHPRPTSLRSGRVNTQR